ncbi:hypothetical protein, partial [Virgisporangium ochraceum]|uniref:hypothetical protein n=1 Tax=Virgisporangium ochraceum TaxID=65505 RepID=UPI0019450B24
MPKPTGDRRATWSPHQQSYGSAFWSGPSGQPWPDVVVAEVDAARPHLLPHLRDADAALADRDDLTDAERDQLAHALRTAWLATTPDRRWLDEGLAYEREHRWHTLRAPLCLYWHADGGPDEPVDVLRAAGLTVDPPGNDGTAIVVRPAGGPHPP